MTVPFRVVPVTTPLAGAHGGRAAALVERNLLVYRRAWPVFASGFFEPLFYLLSLGLGIGALVGDVQTDAGALSYAEFVAPAMLASSAMNGAMFDSTFNVFFKLRYAKTYDAVLATPLSPRDVAVGEVGWALLRGVSYSATFLLVMVAMGLVASPWAVLALPVTVLIGFAFAAVGMWTTTYMRSWQDFEWVQLTSISLFLLSATFYPLSTYPDAVQDVVAYSPLYQGVELLRALTTGAVDLSLVGNVAYLAAMGVAGTVLAGRRVGSLLLR